MDTFANGEGQLLEAARGGRKAEAIERILDLWAPCVPPEERARLRGITSDNYDRLVEFLTRDEPEGRRPAYPVAASLTLGKIPILSISGAHDNPAVNMMMGRFAAEVLALDTMSWRRETIPPASPRGRSLTPGSLGS